jgi:hypothetical protein
MANLEYKNYKIRAIATSVPKDIRTTDSLAEIFGTDLVAKIKKNARYSNGK